MGVALARESLHLATILDLSLRGRIAAALDAASQRLKALEAMARGAAIRQKARASGSGSSVAPDHSRSRRSRKRAPGRGSHLEAQHRSLAVGGKGFLQRWQRQRKRKERERQGRRQVQGQGPSKRRRKKEAGEDRQGLRSLSEGLLRGGCGRPSRTLPVDVDSVERHTEDNVGLEEFHEGLTPLTAGSKLADSEWPTALRGKECQDENSVLGSRAEGGSEEGNLGLGWVVLREEAPAIGKLALPKEGSSEVDRAAVQTFVSPSNFQQLVSMARSILSSMEIQRMQNTVEDSLVMPDDIFPLPLSLVPWSRSKLASADMIYGLNFYARGQGDGPRPKREPCGLVENLGKLCDHFKVWDEPLGNLDFRTSSPREG